MINHKNKKFLLNLAREAIKYYLNTDEYISINTDQINQELFEPAGTFVTLTFNDQLRGCIGHIQPIQELYKDIIDNAINAAFKDPRFPSIVPSELPIIKIEISLLNTPVTLKYLNTEELLAKIKIGDGLIIKYNFHSAVFLPQVWKSLPEKEHFLSHLCNKAGLNSDFWQSGKLDIKTFQVEKFTE